MVCLSRPYIKKLYVSFFKLSIVTKIYLEQQARKNCFKKMYIQYETLWKIEFCLLVKYTAY